MSHDIFISYSRRDTERMQAVRDGLREAGLTVWTDEGIEPGTESWKKALSDAITGCTTVVVLFSPDAAQSTWVNRELDFAELHQKKLYPLLVRGEIKDAVPFGYTTFQFIDIRNDDALQNGILELVSILSKDFPHKNLTPKSHPPIVDMSSSDEEAYPIEQIEPEEKETLWKWVETDKTRICLPHTWKFATTTPENWERIWLLLLPKGKFHEFLVNENQMVSHFTGIPRLKFIRHTVFSDMSSLTPLVGYTNLIKAPIRTSLILNFPFLNSLVVQPSLKRLENYWPRLSNIEIKVHNRGWFTFHDGRCFTFEAHGLGEDGKTNNRTYLFFPRAGNIVYVLGLFSENSRYAKEQHDYDTIAKSFQIALNKD